MTKVLLTPATIKSQKFANRFVLAAMSRTSASNDGIPSKAMAAYYRRFTEGGFGLLIAEGAYTDSLYAQAYSNQPGLVNDAQEAGWKEIVQAVKARNGKIVLQLIHAGAVSQHVKTAHAPSPVRPRGQMLQGYGYKQGTYDVPVELSLSDIETIRHGFVQAAKRAERAGFDGVEIHCANGYLLDQFLTEETNHRQDKYGGSLDNRILLTSEIVAGAKAATGDGFLVGVRLSQAKATEPDYFWPNGLKDARSIFGAVAAAGADFIDLASEKHGYEYHCSTREGDRLTAFAKELTGLPVIANGGLQDLELADEIVQRNEADFVSIGKSALINPDLPTRVAENRPIRPFTFDMFKYGVTVQAQLQWENEQAAIIQAQDTELTVA